MYNTRRGGMNFPASSTFGAVGHASSSSTSSLSGIAGTNLIINYLPQDMSERELYSLFSTMGPIESCKIMRDMKVSQCPGHLTINLITIAHSIILFFVSAFRLDIATASDLSITVRKRRLPEQSNASMV